MIPNVVVIGTCDTKLEELLFLRAEILKYNVEVTLIDVSRDHIKHEDISLSQEKLLRDYGNDEAVGELPRSELIKTMAKHATIAVKEMFDQRSIGAIISAGGSGGTSLAAQVMRDALPIGFPKMIVSTVASGDTGPIVQETDITLMYSVVDVSGLNEVLRSVLNNAGAAIAGMAHAYGLRVKSPTSLGRKRVGVTMFGVTTCAVDTIRKHLESNYEIETYVFHATGHGGKAMERLIRERSLDAILDLTTTEICDQITGGIMSAGPRRLEAALEAGIPNIISVGATDMSNFGPRSTVPERYKDRKLYEHNPVVTLMRTSTDEARQIGAFVAEKVKNHTKDPKAIEIWLPRGGVSAMATIGGPFADTEADSALYEAIFDGLIGTDILVRDDHRDINDMMFAHDIAEALVAKMGVRRTVC